MQLKNIFGASEIDTNLVVAIISLVLVAILLTVFAIFAVKTKQARNKAEKDSKATVDQLEIKFKNTLEELKKDMVQESQQHNETIAPKVTAVEENVKVVDSKVESVETKVSIVDETIKGVDSNIRMVDENIKTVDEGLKLVDSKIVDVDTKIDDVDTSIKQLDEKLEEKLGQSVDDIDSINTNIEKLYEVAKPSTMEEKFAKYLWQIKNLTTEIDEKTTIIKKAILERNELTEQKDDLKKQVHKLVHNTGTPVNLDDEDLFMQTYKDIPNKKANYEKYKNENLSIQDEQPHKLVNTNSVDKNAHAPTYRVQPLQPIKPKNEQVTTQQPKQEQEELKNTVEALQQQILDLATQPTKPTQEHEELKNTVEALQQQILDLATQPVQSTHEQDELKNTVEALQQQVLDLATQPMQSTQEQDELKNTVEALQQQIADLTTQPIKPIPEHEELKNTVEALQQQIADLTDALYASKQAPTLVPISEKHYAPLDDVDDIEDIEEDADDLDDTEDVDDVDDDAEDSSNIDDADDLDNSDEPSLDEPYYDKSELVDYNQYVDNRPRMYTIYFDKQGGNGGSIVSRAEANQMLDYISPPIRHKCDFIGYFDHMDGQGKKYYDALGLGLCEWDKNRDYTLYAYWLQAPYGSLVSRDDDNLDYNNDKE